MRSASQALTGSAVRDGDRVPAGRVLRVFGSPRSGKSELARRAFIDPANREDVRSGGSVLLVPGRVVADDLNDWVLSRVGSSRQSRPVKTIAALAFSVVADDRARRGLIPPKLMDGAEQDRIITEILNTHLRHMENGDDCATCDLFRAYLSVAQAHPDIAPRAISQAQEGAMTSDQVFRQIITPRFVAQLRDVFARMDELDISMDRAVARGQMEGIESDSRIGDSVWTIQAWDLALALRFEYADRLIAGERAYERMDPAQVLVRARRAVEGSAGLPSVPRFVVMDDCQDLTFAGYAFLRAMALRGTGTVLIGGDDESVQGFRGAAPEVLSALEGAGTGMNADLLELRPELDGLARAGGNADAEGTYPSYRRRVAQRLSQAIGTELVQDDRAIALRPGKLRGDVDSPVWKDRPNLRFRLFRTPEEETDDLVWQILHTASAERQRARKDNPPAGDLNRSASELDGTDDDGVWDRMAVIAHDNAQLRQIGQRLESEGIPVSYSSSSVAIKERPEVQGLLAMLRLSRFVVERAKGKDEGTAGEALPEALGEDQAREVHDLLLSVACSPLFPASVSCSKTRPTRPGRIEAGLTALSRLSAITGIDAEGGGTDAFADLRSEWSALIGQAPDEADRTVLPALPLEAFSLLLLVGSDPVRSHIAHLLTQVMMTRWDRRRVARGEAAEKASDSQSDSDDGGSAPEEASGEGGTGDSSCNPDCAAFLRCCQAIRQCASRDLESSDPTVSASDQALWNAWEACGVAQLWQDWSISADSERSREANRRLDMVIRLFHHAENAPVGESVPQFVERIEGLDIEADSLARLAPKPHALMLTTPAGAPNLKADIVWVVGVQDGVWPNMAPRDSLFGAQVLTSIALSRRLSAAGISSAQGTSVSDLLHGQTLSLEYAEAKSLLVALTRARRLTVISAVWSDDAAPSPFLFGFLPECLSRERGVLDPFRDPADAAEGGDGQVGRLYTRVGQEECSQACPRARDAGDATEDARDRPVRNPDGQEADSGFAGTGNGTDAGETQPSPEPVDFGGLDTTTRGLAIACRTILAQSIARRQVVVSGNDADSPASRQELAALGRRIDDASSALALLSGNGVSVANPLEWTFVEHGSSVQVDRTANPPAAHGGLVPHARTPHSAPLAMLSPSGVDSLWQCPLRWAMEKRFGGPQSSNPHMLFGNYIHQSLQWATDEGLDRSCDDEKEIARRLQDHLDGLSAASPAFRSPDDAYLLRQLQAETQTIFSHAAHYFVASRAEDYTTQTKYHMPGVGGLKESHAEVRFSADFDLGTILRVVRNTPGLSSTTAAELFSAIATLAGGLADGFDPETRIRLTARIDRLERRSRAGKDIWDILDWKTGRTPNGKERFSDLQLVCYQLGVAFGLLEGVEDVPKQVDRAVLFHLTHETDPQTYHGRPEGSYQPALFRRTGRMGLDTAFQPRLYAKSVNNLFTTDPRQVQALREYSGQSALAQALVASSADGSQDQTYWALSMISRVIYAASFVHSDIFPAKKDPSVCRVCAFQQICPAWSEDSSTVYGPLSSAHLSSVDFGTDEGTKDEGGAR